MTQPTESAAAAVDSGAVDHATVDLSQETTAEIGNGEFVPNEQLFEIATRSFGGELTPATDARSLHLYLGNGENFATWIKQRIEQYGFVENVDYVTYRGAPDKQKGGRPTQEYAITISMAKELSMVERSGKGKAARKYFIECERYAREAFMTNLAAPVAPAIDEVRRAEAIIAQRDLVVAYYLEQAQALTGKMYRAVKPPTPRVKELPAIDEKTQGALNKFLDQPVEYKGATARLGDLVNIVADPQNEEEKLQLDPAITALRAVGMMVENKMMVVGTGTPYMYDASLKVLGSKTALRPLLLAVPGSERTDRALSFGGVKSKIIRVPLSALCPRLAGMKP